MANSGSGVIVAQDVLEKFTTSVQVRRSFSDAWQTVPYLKPSDVAVMAAPSISQATIVYNFGPVGWQESNHQYQVYLPRELQGWFLRVLAHTAGNTVEQFTGIVVDQEFHMHGADVAPTAGDQVLVALGLEFMLTNRVVVGAWVVESELAGDAASTGGYVKSTPSFNHKRRQEAVINGNRSASPVDGVYRFSVGSGNIWSNLDILQYLINFYGPPGLPLGLSGEYSALAQIKSFYRLEGHNLKQCFELLIDRHRGLGWYIRCAENAAYLHVYTVFNTSVRLGEGSVVPANPEQVSINTSNHVDLEQALVRTQSNSQFDQILVIGDPIETTFSLKIAQHDGDDALLHPTRPGMATNGLIRGWWDAKEAAYRSSINTSNPVDGNACDEARRAEYFEDVFQRFVIEDQWNGLALEMGEPGLETQPNAIPVFHEGILQTGMRSSLYMGNKVFLRELPIKKDGTDEFMAPMAFMEAPDIPLLPEHEPSVFVQLDKTGDTDDRPSATLRTLDDAAGVLIKSKVNHVLAKNTFPDVGGTYLTNHLPVYDYRTLIVTASMQLDERLAIQRVIRNSDSPRVLWLDAPHCKLQYITPGTAIGINSLGLERHSGGIVRNDYDKLETVAALAAAWYGPERNQIVLSIPNAVKIAEVGQVVNVVTNGWQRVQVNTVVTCCRWRYEDQRVLSSIETGYYEIDVSHILEFPGLGGQKGIARKVHTLIRDVQDLQRADTNKIVRMPAIGGGGAQLVDGLGTLVIHSHNGPADGGYSAEYSGGK